jgi:hypothetical protein
MQEIRTASRNQTIGFIDFEDENISMDRKWFGSLLAEITHHFQDQRPELRAMNGLYPPSLDRALINQMRTAGFRELNLSVGSFDERQTRRWNRPSVNPDFDRILGWAAAAGMTAVAYIIAGAPRQDALTTVNDLLFLTSRRALAGLSIYYPAPGSADFDICRKAGLLPPSPLCWRSTALPIEHTTRREESLTLLRLSRTLNFMKLCIDETGSLPEPTPFTPGKIRPNGNRSEVGRQLLSWFLDDGIFRGSDRHGRIFSHKTVTHLTHAFLEGLQTVQIRGYRL